MGRSTPCFKIIACGGASGDEEDSAVPESKGSSDKRGWSFQKRSARHRVLSNTVINETPSSGNKEGPEAFNLNSQPPSESAGPEKISVQTKPPDESAGPDKISVQTKPPGQSAGPDKISVQNKPPDESPAREKMLLQNRPPSEPASPEKISLQNNSPAESVAPEEISVQTGTDEKPHLSTMVETKIPEVVLVAENDIGDDDKVKEYIVIVIQAAIRGLLAQNELVKRKNVVKLQAAVRGHLVRRHAVGTLRCVQAIIKMQALVRARRARISLEVSNVEPDVKRDEDGCSSRALRKDNSADISCVKYTSIEKLLSNRFARQLLESSPKANPTNIKCDPSKRNSAWKWLERWMSVSSAEPSPDTESMTQRNDQQDGDNDKDFSAQVLAKETAEVSRESPGFGARAKEVIATPEGEENRIPCDALNSNLDTCDRNSSFRDNLVQCHAECKSASHTKEVDVVSNQTLQLVGISQTEIDTLSMKPEVEGDEKTKESLKQNDSENLDPEGSKFVLGSRKATNPASVVERLKFKELSSSTRSKRSTTSSTPSVGADLELNAVSSGGNIVADSEPKELSKADNSVPENSMAQLGGSECGMELSISPALDSPDRTEVEAPERKFRDQVSEEVAQSTYVAGNVELEGKNSSTIPVSNLSHPVSDQLEKFDHANIDSNDSLTAENFHKLVQKPEDSSLDLQRDLESEKAHQSSTNNSVMAENSHKPDPKPEESALGLQRDLETEIGHQSPEASPRSHIIRESQETPSSQMSVRAKRDGSDKSGSNHKRKSLSAGKRSPSSSYRYSGTKGSAEQLSKDQKTGKRRNSFGSTKNDHPRDSDHDPRDSGSSDSLPRFMQATESARAKTHANYSPRSSPDVHEKEIHIKKRQSLPGVSGKQGSPRIQRTSQVQQDAKGNTSHTQERKWQR